MSKIYDKETLLKKYEIEKSCINDSIEALEKSKEIILQFDNKVLNIRLGNKVGEHVGSELGYFHINKYQHANNQAELEFRCRNRHIQHNHTLYADIYDLICVMGLELIDDKRINANQWIEQIDIKITSLKTALKKMEHNILIVNDLIAEQKQIIEFIDTFNAKLDHINSDMIKIERRF